MCGLDSSRHDRETLTKTEKGEAKPETNTEGATDSHRRHGDDTEEPN